jgi:moderate conductance mechanosensitive channel
MDLHDIDHWLRNSLLPTVLLILGAVLVARAARWIGDRYRASVDQEVLQIINSGGVVPERAKRARAMGQAGVWLTVSLVYFIAGIVALGQLGVPLTSLIAPATVAGVAIGFGAQQVVGDMLAGFFLFAEHQFGVGDVIQLAMPGQLTGISGTVEELTFRVTKLRSQQGEVIVIPNSALRQVTNLSKDWSRVVIDVPVPVEEDLPHAISVIQQVANRMASEEAWRDQILGEPMVSGVETIEVGYVQLRLLVRTQPGRQFEVGRELRLRLVLAFRDEHIRTATAPTIQANSR